MLAPGKILTKGKSSDYILAEDYNLITLDKDEFLKIYYKLKFYETLDKQNKLIIKDGK